MWALKFCAISSRTGWRTFGTMSSAVMNREPGVRSITELSSHAGLGGASTWAIKVFYPSIEHEPSPVILD